MAKSKSFFGLRSGSTKTLTFQVNQGRQITKDRVYDVKNPRTRSQMEGRCLMATVSAAYAHMKEIADHSFEGVTYGQNNMSEFIRQNYALVKADSKLDYNAFGYNAYRDRGLYPGAYIIANGSASDVLGTVGLQVPISADAEKNSVVTFSLPTGATGTTATDWLKAHGLNVGDMATIIILYGKRAATDYGFLFVRLTAIADGTTTLTSANFQQYIKVESNAPVSAVTFNNGRILITCSTPDVEWTENTPIFAQGVIHSLKAANGWLRNKCVLSVPDDADLGESFASALSTYPIGGSYVLNGGAIQ